MKWRWSILHSHSIEIYSSIYFAWAQRSFARLRITTAESSLAIICARKRSVSEVELWEGGILIFFISTLSFCRSAPWDTNLRGSSLLSAIPMSTRNNWTKLWSGLAQQIGGQQSKQKNDLRTFSRTYKLGCWSFGSTRLMNFIPCKRWLPLSFSECKVSRLWIE